MDNRLIFLYRVYCDGVTEKARFTGCWLSREKYVGKKLWKIRVSITEVRDHRFFNREVADAMLPRKSSKLQVKRDRTLNRHRWVG